MAEFEKPYPEMDEKKSKVTGFLFRSLVYSFALFGFLFILLAWGIFSTLKQEKFIPAEVPDQAILSIDFDDFYPETRVDDLISEIAEVDFLSFYDLIRAINLAAVDKRVEAIVANVSDTNLGMAQIQEVREAILKFRASGKKAYIYSSGFGTLGGGMGEYYLASAFDEISMIPNGEVGITGISIEVPFFKKSLDKIGVEPEFYTRYEYKNAVASLTSTHFSKEHKEEMEKLGQGLYSQMLGDIGKARNLGEDFGGLVNIAPIFDKEALSVKLVDKLGYKQDLMAKISENGKIEEIKVSDYAGAIADPRGKVPVIAYLVIDGVISSGESAENPMQGDAVVGSTTIAEQVKEIAKEKSLKALVVRVNSPGGSYTASNEIWYALAKLKADKKIPIIVSMGDYAASGGYFVALAGDHILADSSTITGSIGVLGGKIVLKDMWNKLGVNWEGVKFGDNAGILSSNSKLSKSEKDVFERSLDNIYKDFTGKVSGARGIDLDSLDKLARGRVWLGNDAVKIGLIDEIGGLDKAISVAKERAGIEPYQKFSIAYYPLKKSLQEKLADILTSRRKANVGTMLGELGFGQNEMRTLQSLKYDAVLMPMVIR